MKTLHPTPTPPELLGELITLRNLEAQARGLYSRNVGTPDASRLLETWQSITSNFSRTEGRLYETMRRQQLAQVVTAGYKARIEHFEGDPFVALYRTTDHGEERLT